MSSTVLDALINIANKAAHTRWHVTFQLLNLLHVLLDLRLNMREIVTTLALGGYLRVEQIISNITQMFLGLFDTLLGFFVRLTQGNHFRILTGKSHICCLQTFFKLP